MGDYIVYLAESPSGKKYVGITDNFHTRKLQHLNKAKNGSKLQFHQAIKKYEDKIIWNILDTAKDKKEACKKEIEWIAKLDTYKTGYNMTRGGQITPESAKEGTRKYIAKPENQDKRAKECGGKPFLVFKVDGSFIGKFVNIKRFCRENNIDRRNFISCLAGKKEYVEGFIPVYKENFNKEKIRKIVNKIKNLLKYIEFEVYTVKDEFVGKWSRMSDCCRDLNLDKACLSKCLKGKRKTHKRYKFRLIN